jgi:hypothetical protein
MMPRRYVLQKITLTKASKMYYSTLFQDSNLCGENVIPISTISLMHIAVIADCGKVTTTEMG